MQKTEGADAYIAAVFITGLYIYALFCQSFANVIGHDPAVLLGG